MVVNEMLFLVGEDQTVDALGLQNYDVLFHMVRPQFIDNLFVTNCLLDVFYYLYLEDVPAIDSDAASIFVARKAYLDWVMQTEEFKRLKVNTIGKKDKSLIVSVQIVNAIIDAYLKVIKQFTDEDVQLINRFMGHKATLYSATFLQDQSYPDKLSTLETEVCQKVVCSLEQDRESIIKEIGYFFDDLLLIEKKMFDNIEVPFTLKR